MVSLEEWFAAPAAFFGTAAEHLAQHFAWAVRRSLSVTRIEFAHVIPRALCNRELRCQPHVLASHAFCRLDHNYGTPADAVRLPGWQSDPVRHPDNHPSVL